MENATLYSHHLKFDHVVQLVRKHLPDVKLKESGGEIQRSLVATTKSGFFSKKRLLTLNYRQREVPSYKLEEANCGLTQNLAGMVNFIQSLPAKNEAVRNKFLYKVMAVNCEISFVAEPEITDELAGILKEIITSLDAFLFVQPSNFFTASEEQHFLDKNLNLILDTEGNSDIEDLEVQVDAKYHDQPAQTHSAEQKDRKAKSEAFLASHEVKINKNLPSVPDAASVKLRGVGEVVGRAYALLITSAKGEGVENEHLDKIIEAKKIDSFSPKERLIYEADALEGQEKAYATWRYESLYTILWALGIMEELKYPNEICDVETIVNRTFQPSREEFEEKAKLRNVVEILDELDKTYRMHWACVDARLKSQQVSGGINPSIIYERHYALNWLTHHLDQDWDEVETHT